MSSLLTLAGNAAPTGFYDFPIEQSLRFNDNDSAYLSRTPASAGNQKTWTLSFWLKPCNQTINRTILARHDSGSNTFVFRLDQNDNLQIENYVSAYQLHLITNAKFRDSSAWYHIVLTIDTTQATSSDRARLYVNGEQVTSFSASIYPSQNTDLKVNAASAHRIGTRAPDNYLDGYLADVNFIDGQALDPTSFGEFKSGIWIPKDTSGLTFGTNGFRLQFGDSAAIGDDTSGNTNDWTVNNLVASDVVLDSPTNNWCVCNPFVYRWSITAPVLSEGNLKIDPASNTTSYVLGTMGVSSGKWYFEGMVDAVATTAIGFGVGNEKLADSTETDSIFYKRGSTGTIRSGGSDIATGVGDISADDVVGVYLNLDDGEISFYNNGSIVGASPYSLPTTGITLLPAILQANANNFYLNFGQDSTFTGRRAAGGNADENGYGDFAYAPPTGALSLCSANLPKGAIDTLNDETPEDYFKVSLHTGTGSQQAVTGIGFAPDFRWTKSRGSAYSHILHDNVRGETAYLQSNNTNSENTLANMSLDSDGFTVHADDLGDPQVSWLWKAGGAGVSNTDGSITSTVSVGATSQQNWFSVVSYTGNGTAGATVGHGLNTPVDMYIVKSRDNARDWRVYHSSLGATKALQLNKTDAANTSSAFWNNTEPTSSVFSIGSVTTVNGSGEDYIAYCFANAEGLCKVGSYTGNGSTDGTFVYTGFRPAWVMWKRTDAVTTSNWFIVDNKRDTYNVVNSRVWANATNAESDADSLDFLSSGFKIRSSANLINASGGSYIYLAIAEQDFRFANAR